MKKKRQWVTGINYLMILLFLLAAGLQYNDMDSALWMVTYGVAALFCILWKWSPIYYYWYIGLGSVCMVWAVSLIVFHVDQLSWDGMFASMQMQNYGIEIIREAGGLIIVALWMGVLAYVPAYGDAIGQENEVG